MFLQKNHKHEKQIFLGLQIRYYSKYCVIYSNHNLRV
jgi:hypothetical protein